MSSGWVESAPAWIASVGEDGDYGRKFVLDEPMLARVKAGGFRDALDVGCGEGRFCRLLKKLDIKTIGIDPTEILLQHAMRLDPEGDYRVGHAEDLGFPDSAFDLVVSYLTLVDIPDIKKAIAEMVRVLRPGGALLIANLNSFNTAGPPTGWVRDADGERRFFIDQYLQERAQWISWNGIRIQNWHRPLSTYMSVLLEQGLELRHFSEPAPVGGEPEKAAHYKRVPYFLIMEWRKPK
jgi:SAM-dependent methyltransferase